MMHSTDSFTFAVAAFLLLCGGDAAVVGVESSGNVATSCCETLVAHGAASGVHDCEDFRLSVVQVESRKNSPSSIEAAKGRARLHADQAFMEDAWERAVLSLPEMAGLIEEHQQLLIRALLPPQLDGTLEGVWTCAEDTLGRGTRRGEVVRVIRAVPVDGIILKSDPREALQSFCEDTLKGTTNRFRAMLVFELVPEDRIEQHIDHLAGVLGESDFSEVRAILRDQTVFVGPPDPGHEQVQATVVTGNVDVDALFLELESRPHDMETWLRLARELSESGWPRASQLVAARCLRLELDPANEQEFALLTQDDWARSIAGL